MKNFLKILTGILVGTILWIHFSVIQVQAASRPVVVLKKGFKIPDYYPAKPGETNKLRSILMGDEARPQFGGQTPIKGLKLILFNTDGETNMVAQAEECIFDQSSQIATSEGVLRFNSGDGRLEMRGVGFLWRQTNSTVVISNKVHTKIQQNNPFEILGNQFEYQGLSNEVFYRGGVVVQEASMRIASDLLFLRLPGSGQDLEYALADKNVKIQLKDEGIEISAGRAVYLNTNRQEWIDLTGSPSWIRGYQSGRADQLRFERQSKNVIAQGNTYTKIPQTGTESVTFFMPGLESSTNAASKPEGFLEIFSDKSIMQPGKVAFEGQVRIREDRGGEITHISCGILNLDTPESSNQVNRIEMKERVLVQQADKRLTGELLIYTQTNRLIEITGQPTWRLPPHMGAAEKISYPTDTKVLQARGKAWIKMHMGSTNFSLGIAALDKKIETGDERYLRIESNEYDLSQDEAIFRGNVHIRDIIKEKTQGILTCGRLNVSFFKNGKGIKSIVAEDTVVLEQGIPGQTKGPDIYRKISCKKIIVDSDQESPSYLRAEGGIHFQQGDIVAEGGSLLYNLKQEWIELKDSPRIKAGRGIIYGEIIHLDRNKNEVKIPAPYKWRYQPNE